MVVGASATASLIVGGLIFALASRRRRCKKVSKLQLADEAEEKGKVQEEYKVTNFYVYFRKIDFPQQVFSLATLPRLE